MARWRNISIIRYAPLQLEHNAQLQNVDLQDDSYTHWQTLRRHVYRERKNNDHALEIGKLRRPKDNERKLGNTTAHWGMATNNAHNIEQDVPINTAGMLDVYIVRTYFQTYRRESEQTIKQHRTQPNESEEKHPRVIFTTHQPECVFAARWCVVAKQTPKASNSCQLTTQTAQ